MRLLLDTHVAIWAVSGTANLKREVLEMIADRQNDIYVSVISILEIAIKHATGRWSAPPFTGLDSVRYFERADFSFLDVTLAHALGVEALPKLHADPFDRLLIAQALAEPLRLITRDRRVAAYSDTILLV